MRQKRCGPLGRCPDAVLTRQAVSSEDFFADERWSHKALDASRVAVSRGHTPLKGGAMIVAEVAMAI